jgi:periplasmic protein TonB
MGKSAMDIKSNLAYPKSARKARITGTVYVGFVIGKDGVARDLEVMRGVSPECDAAALHAVSKLNKWKPGMQKKDIPGYPLKPVSVRFVLPIKFSM